MLYRECSIVALDLDLWLDSPRFVQGNAPGRGEAAERFALHLTVNWCCYTHGSPPERRGRDATTERCALDLDLGAHKAPNFNTATRHKPPGHTATPADRGRGGATERSGLRGTNKPTGCRTEQPIVFTLETGTCRWFR